MVEILFQNTTIYHMSIHSNAFEMIELCSWIHNPKFNQIKKVAINVRVMIIENINLENCLTNGTIPKISTVNFHANNKIKFIKVILIDSQLQIK
jgi:hypothetical protein